MLVNTRRISDNKMCDMNIDKRPTIRHINKEIYYLSLLKMYFKQLYIYISHLI